jgi:hypothetical protein
MGAFTSEPVYTVTFTVTESGRRRELTHTRDEMRAAVPMYRRMRADGSITDWRVTRDDTDATGDLW